MCECLGGVNRGGNLLLLLLLLLSCLVLSCLVVTLRCVSSAVRYDNFAPNCSPRPARHDPPFTRNDDFANDCSPRPAARDPPKSNNQKRNENRHRAPGTGHRPAELVSLVYWSHWSQAPATGHRAPHNRPAELVSLVSLVYWSHCFHGFHRIHGFHGLHG